MRIGFVVGKRDFYGRVMASTRIRVYDVIRVLNREKGVRAELYSFFGKYDAVVFQKTFSEKYISLAAKLKKRGVKVILDINVNYIDPDSTQVSEKQRDDMARFLSIADAVIVSSPYLMERYGSVFSNLFLIEEMIESSFFRTIKIHDSVPSDMNFLYCGYAVKASELYMLKNMIIKLNGKYGIGLLIIADRDPKLDIIPYRFVKYNHIKLPEILTEGDIGLNPRDVLRKYNLGHSFTKVGYPMAVGLPVAASPVPSYAGSPAVLCEDTKDFEEALTGLIEDKRYREDLAFAGREYIVENFSESVILNKYLRMFDEVC